MSIDILSIEDIEGDKPLVRVDMSKETQECVTSLGLEFLLTCAAYSVDIQDAMDQIRLRGEYLEQQENTDDAM